MGTFGKRHKGWTQWTHFSVPRPHTSPQPSEQLTLLASAPAGGHVHAAHRCAQGGMRRCILIALCFLVAFFFPSPSACLLLVVTKFGCPCWRGNFCFWTTEFFICSDQISCKKEEANKWSICMPCSHSACCGLEGTKALYSYHLVVSRCFSGGQFTCLPASGHALRLACSRCLNMHVC